MGAGGVKLTRQPAGVRWLRVLLAAGVLSVAALVGFGPGAAQAAACDTSWTGGNGNWFTVGNWDNGIPTSATNACVTSGNVTVDISGQTAVANSLTVGGDSGTQTVRIDGTSDGTTPSVGSLTLESGGSIANPHGEIRLSSTCSGDCSMKAPGESELTVAPGATLTNDGTLRSGIGDFPNEHVLNGNITNNAVINIDAPAEYGANAGGTLDNAGQLFLNFGHGLTVDSGHSSTVINDTGGSIANQGSAGSLTVADGDTFEQGTGEVDAPTNGVNYSVIVDGTTSSANLTYTGASSPSASTIAAEGQVNLTGGPAANQHLVVNGVASCPTESQVTASSGFTNAGTISLAGTCSSLKLTSGTLTNAGTLVAEATGTSEISGSLSNAGTMAINGNTAFDASGASLAQTAGSTTIAPGVIFDASASAATFDLQGGVLAGGGQDQAHVATFTGNVNNTGGNVIPGSATQPGLMTFDGDYTQGSGATLTEVVDGPASAGAGTAYGQLGLTGNATLAGTLAVTTVANPSVGDFDIALASARSPGVIGKFSHIAGEFQPEGPFPPGWTFGYQPGYQPSYMGLSADPAAGLRVSRAGPGTGAVTSSPAGISCGRRCDAPFFQTQTVTLTAHAGAGSAFGSWSGACSGRAVTCSVNMSQAQTVTARFLHRTATALISSRNPAKVRATIAYIASVSPRPTGGKVSFSDGGKPIAGCGGVSLTSTGKAVCEVRYRSAGRHRIHATYLGNSSYASSASSTLTEKVIT